MGTLDTRLRRLEQDVRTHAGNCTDPWHEERDPLATRQVDYRVAAGPLMPGYAPPVGPAPEDRCPSCGEARLTIRIVARDVPVGQSLGFGHRLTVPLEDPR